MSPSPVQASPVGSDRSNRPIDVYPGNYASSIAFMEGKLMAIFANRFLPDPLPVIGPPA